VHEVCGRSVLECQTVRDEADGPRVHHGRSVFLDAILEVRVAISDGPCPPRGQSAPSSRTVRPDTTDVPPGAFQIALSPLRFELCFRVGLVWDLFLGFLVVPLRLFEPCLGSCLCLWVRGAAIGV
jgi:hypothetical protein